MATATMATAAGAAALLYYTLNKKLQSNSAISVEDDDNDQNGGAGEISSHAPLLGIDRVSHRLIQAPATWLETIRTLSETLRFTYSETLGKWPIGELAFGINFLWKQQGVLHVSSIYGSRDSIQLRGSEITAELKYLLNLLTLCWHFSKKRFPVFLEETGYSIENVLLQEPKAGILKPSFTILIDHKTNHFILLIRGTHSIKDTLTAVTGAVVPFHHSVVNEGGVSNLVLGYAHCGMVAAARWIAKLATPCLVAALVKYPTYRVKIIGHSLGGGTAALLTYILREQKEFSTTTCVTFAPAACMTWELAESGNDFITSVINGADLVPTFSAASVDDLRVEVTASAWLNDLRNQIEQTRILNTVYRSATALGSRLPTIASAKAKVAGAGAMLRPVSSGTQVVMKRAQSMAQTAWSRRRLQLSSWSCIGPPRHQATIACSNKEKDENAPELPTSEIETSETNPEEPSVTTFEKECSCSEETFPHIDQNKPEDLMNEVELWQQLEHELYGDTEHEDADLTLETMEEVRSDADMAHAIMEEVGKDADVANEMKEVHRFYPAGKIMHIVTLNEAVTEGDSEPTVGIFLTPRSLYSKLRLSQTMISDHLMPVYRRQIEKLIKDFENENNNLDENCDKATWEVLC